MLSTNFRRNAIGAIGDATGKRKVQKPSDIPGLRRKKAKKVSLRQNGVFIVDLQSSRSARTPKRKSAKKVEFHNSLFNTVHQMCTLSISYTTSVNVQKYLNFQRELFPLLVKMWNAGWRVSKESKAPLYLLNCPLSKIQYLKICPSPFKHLHLGQLFLSCRLRMWEIW